MNYSKLPKTRQAAARLGIYKYFTGKPCIHGHIAPRYVTNAACETCCIEHAKRSTLATRKLLKRSLLERVLLAPIKNLTSILKRA